MEDRSSFLFQAVTAVILDDIHSPSLALSFCYTNALPHMGKNSVHRIPQGLPGGLSLPRRGFPPLAMTSHGSLKHHISRYVTPIQATEKQVGSFLSVLLHCLPSCHTQEGRSQGNHLNEAQLTAHGIHARSTTTPHQLAPNDTPPSSSSFPLLTRPTCNDPRHTTAHPPSRSHIDMAPSPERVAAAAARPRANLPTKAAGREGNKLATRPEGIRLGAMPRQFLPSPLPYSF